MKTKIKLGCLTTSLITWTILFLFLLATTPVLYYYTAHAFRHCEGYWAVTIIITVLSFLTGFTLAAFAGWVGMIIYRGYRYDAAASTSHKALLGTLCGVGIGLWVLFLIAHTVAMAMGTWAYTRTVPSRSGTVSVVEGLDGDVTLTYDENQVLHVHGNTDRDAVYGMGYAHAMERLWQMELNRRVAAGRVSQMVGNASIEIDILFRSIGAYEAAQRDVDKLETNSKDILQSYADGVNKYINTGSLPLELQFLGDGVEEWTLADTIAYIKLVSWLLSDNAVPEMRRLNLLIDGGYTYEQVEDFKPPYDPTKPTLFTEDELAAEGKPLRNKTQEDFEGEAQFVSEMKQWYENCRPFQSKLNFRQSNTFSPESKSQNRRRFWIDRFRNTGAEFLSMASNSWVVSGNHTDTGMPYLANDPHLPLSAPMIWVLAHIESEEAGGYNVTGATLPGAFPPLIGRTNRFAWGITVAGMDQQDTFVMRENEDGTQYQLNGTWTDYTIRNELIEVNGGEDIELEVKETIYGPVINDAFPDQLPQNAPPIALQWVSAMDIPEYQNTPLDSLLQIPKCQNWDEFYDTMKQVGEPSLTFVYGDTDGDIGLVVPAAMPLRPDSNYGKYPSPGNGAWGWTGYIPVAEQPSMKNPASGIIATANNKIVPPSYRYFLGFDYSQGYRAERIDYVLFNKTANGEKVTFADMESLQKDQVSMFWKDWKFVGDALLQDQDQLEITDDSIYWIEQLNEWDGDTSLDAKSRETTMLEAWLVEMVRKNPEGMNEVGYATIVAWVQRLRKHLNTDQCYGQSCRQYAADALNRASSTLGRHPPEWGHGIHPAVYPHDVLSATPLACLGGRQRSYGGTQFTVNVGPYTDVPDGDADRVAPGSGFHLEMRWGASYRQLVDLHDMEQSRFIMPMGQSGHLMSSDFDSWLPPWLRGEYFPMTMGGYDQVSQITLEDASE